MGRTGPRLVYNIVNGDSDTHINETPKQLGFNPGEAEGFHLYNSAVDSAWLKFYNKKTGDITMASDEPDVEFELLPQQWNNIPISHIPKHLNKHIAVAATLNQGADNTAPTADIQDGHIEYTQLGGGL